MASIKYPESAKNFLKFIKTKDSRYVLFKTGAHLMMTAASVGFYEGERVHILNYDRKDPIPFDVFKSNGLENYLLIIMINSVNSSEEVPALMEDERLRMKIIEEYANAGFIRMQNMYEEAGGDSVFVDNLADYMLDTIPQG